MEEVYDLNCLGITLNENITWRIHVEEIASKALKSLAF